MFGAGDLALGLELGCGGCGPGQYMWGLPVEAICGESGQASVSGAKSRLSLLLS